MRSALALLWERACSRRRPDSRPVFCGCTHSNCRSEPARDSGLPAELFLADLLNPIVGASLLAKTAFQPTVFPAAWPQPNSSFGLIPLLENRGS